MSDNCIWHGKNLFTIYVGLTAAGYDLAKIPENKEIHNVIHGIHWNEDVIIYFSKARTNTCEVNAYWARDYFLSLASLYITENDGCAYTNFHDVIDYIKSNQFNPDDIGLDTIKWLQQLPIYYSKIASTEGFDYIWENYLNEMKEASINIQAVMDDALSNILNLLDVSEEALPKIVLIPNRLQAPQCANYIKKDGITYIIKAIPDVESIVHEYLHSILEKYLFDTKSIIVEHLYLLEPVFDEMIRYQYAWKFDAESWFKVFEENLVRAMTLWICFLDNKEAAFSKAYGEEKSGFIYVPVILDALMSKWNGLCGFCQFIEICLMRSDVKRGEMLV